MVTEAADAFIVNTGALTCSVLKQGDGLINSLKINGKTYARNGRLVAILEERLREKERITLRQTTCRSEVEEVVIEQDGPVRSVLKVKGTHSIPDQENGLPFIVRLYFYQRLSTIRIVHTMIYDQKPEEVFVKGLGVAFTVPLDGEAWNRNIRFAGEKGMYSEASQLLQTRRFSDGLGQYRRQINGETVVLNEKEHRELLEHVNDQAIWNDFKLVQASSEHYKVMKRTAPDYSWIDALHGRRSNGLCYIGGEQGGVAVGLRDFWQKYPSTIEVQALSMEDTELKVWFWSPEAEAMDMRHYDGETHVISAYEGFNEMRATPVGIANTNEVQLKLFPSSPPHEELTRLAREWQSPSLLVCEPEYYWKTKALGVWSYRIEAHRKRRNWKCNWSKHLLFTSKKLNKGSGTVFGIMEILCTPMIQLGINGVTILADLLGKIQSLLQIFGYGTLPTFGKGGCVSSR